MVKTVRKEYYGKVEVRSYDVQKCITKGENMVIKYDGRKMTLTPLQLSKLAQVGTRKFISKSGGQDYVLYGYEFVEDPKVEKKQKSVKA